MCRAFKVCEVCADFEGLRYFPMKQPVRSISDEDLAAVDGAVDWDVGF
jgi:hypothetical protein